MIHCDVCDHCSDKSIKIHGNIFHDNEICIRVQIRCYKERIAEFKKNMVFDKEEFKKENVEYFNNRNNLRYHGKLTKEEIEELALDKINQRNHNNFETLRRYKKIYKRLIKHHSTYDLGDD